MYRRLGWIVATMSLAIALTLVGVPTSMGEGDGSKNRDTLDASGLEAAVDQAKPIDGLKNPSPAPILSAGSGGGQDDAERGNKSVDADSIAQELAAAISSLPIIVSSTDVPIAIPDDNPTGITSTLVAPDMVIADLNLIFDDLVHTCIPDLHIELTSPFGTTVEIVEAFSQGGILQGFGCPDDFVDTVLDDDAPSNLQSGTGPFTGSFNVEHASVVVNPLSVFDGENAAGTWTLFISDLAGGDVGTLNAWSLEIVPETPIATPTPTPSATSTPTPTATPTPAPMAPIQGEVQLKVQLKFNKPSQDKIQLKVKDWTLPVGVIPTDVTVDVGGAAFTGTLDAKGRFKSLDGRDSIKMKQSKKTQLWNINVKRKNNDFAADLADEGLTDADNPKPGLAVAVPLTIQVGGDIYGEDVSLLYKSKLGKKGIAK